MRAKLCFLAITVSLLFAANSLHAEPAEDSIEPEATLWVGLAAGLYKDQANAYAVTGMGQSLNRETALIRAINNCRTNNSPAAGNCSAVLAFSSGCGYVSVGTRRTPTLDAKWGKGDSAQAAWNSCSAGGFNCIAPRGGCIQH